METEAQRGYFTKVTTLVGVGMEATVYGVDVKTTTLSFKKQTSKLFMLKWLYFVVKTGKVFSIAYQIWISYSLGKCI